MANNCPACHSFHSVTINNNLLTCSQCSFSIEVLCPICNVGKLEIQSDHTMTCGYCHGSISSDLFEYASQNKLKLDSKNTCHSCGGIMMQRDDLNIYPRCIHAPNCGSQQSLFQTDQSPIVFVDIETTGLDMATEQIIEIGACKVDEKGKEHFFMEFISSNRPLSSTITRITGITDEMLAHAPELSTVLPAFATFCSGCDVVAHNAQFDIPWINVCFMEAAIELPYHRVLCTLNWAKKVEAGKRSLGALAKKYNIGHENAHRALADAVVTRRLFFEYERQYGDPTFEDVKRYADMAKKVVERRKGMVLTKD